MAYENYTIEQFENAWFKGDRSLTGIPEEDFQTVYDEYIDTTKMFDNDEFEKVSYINYLNSRTNYVKMACRLQREFFNNFQIPFISQLETFKRWGYTLFWDGNAKAFLTHLERIEEREMRYVHQMEGKIKELTEFRAKRNNGEAKTIKGSRENFIRTRNSLGKVGYKIEKDKTTVEEFSLMILQQIEEVEELKNRQKNY